MSFSSFHLFYKILLDNANDNFWGCLCISPRVQIGQADWLLIQSALSSKLSGKPQADEAATVFSVLPCSGVAGNVPYGTKTVLQ